MNYHPLEKSYRLRLQFQLQTRTALVGTLAVILFVIVILIADSGFTAFSIQRSRATALYTRFWSLHSRYSAAELYTLTYTGGT